ncbi:MSMEG_6728 family protein [Knoellia sp. CPCC 206450]|uniref:MSMEG_6728 family protein n=1 Tax=Knoellia tibetensis TaxID=3404798 RepID=UPI003B42C31D
MQTFLPWPDPRDSAAALDDRRLGKQRVETFQVLRALTWPTYGWKNHPATRMWRGFVPGLVAYGLACVDEWRARGRADATRASLLEFTGGHEPDWDALHDSGRLPPWVGDEAVHLSHRSALVRKDPEHYRPLFGDVPDDLPYVWPDPSYPRWPLPSTAEAPLHLADAVAHLGLDAPPPHAEEVVTRLRAGNDVVLADEDAAEAPTLGLLAGLCTRGTTLWVVDRSPLTSTAPAPQAREGTGAVSSSIARRPTEADRLAMAEEAATRPEFRFVRRGLVTHELADDLGAGLVVTPRAADPGPETGRPRLVLP